MKIYFNTKNYFPVLKKNLLSLINFSNAKSRTIRPCVYPTYAV